MTHYLKILPQYYCRVVDGSKTFEVRKNDRGFQPNDIVILKEYDPEINTLYPNGFFTKSPQLKFKIGYILSIDSEMVVFSLLKYDEGTLD